MRTYDTYVVRFPKQVKTVRAMPSGTKQQPTAAAFARNCLFSVTLFLKINHQLKRRTSLSARDGKSLCGNRLTDQFKQRSAYFRLRPSFVFSYFVFSRDVFFFFFFLCHLLAVGTFCLEAQSQNGPTARRKNKHTKLTWRIRSCTTEPEGSPRPSTC